VRDILHRNITSTLTTFDTGVISDASNTQQQDAEEDHVEGNIQQEDSTVTEEGKDNQVNQEDKTVRNGINSFVLFSFLIRLARKE
jgi:hypothetical protein